MGARINRRVREQAAILCAIAASNDDLCISDVSDHLEWHEAFHLAFKAMRIIPRVDEEYELAAAEAEAMLRTGWCP